MNPGLPQNAPWVPTSQLVGPYQTIVSNPRRRSRRGRLRRGGVRLRPTTTTGKCVPLPPGCRQIYGWPRCTVDCGPVPEWPVLNPTPLAWAGIGLGAAALAGGGYYLWQRRATAELAADTGVTVNADCTKLTVTDADVAPAYSDDFVGTAFAALAGAPVSTLVFAASYLETVAPHCGVAVTDAGVEGVDTWQKAALVGGMAMLFSGALHGDGRIDDAVFKLQAEAIQAFLLENGVDDPAMVEDVFELPSSEGTAQPGGFGPEQLGLYEEPLRAPNMGVIGWGLTALGAGAAAAAGGAGYLWWRNRRLSEACLGTRAWLTDDKTKLTPETDAALEAAIEDAIADQGQIDTETGELVGVNAIDAADAAIVTLSGHPDCHLPTLIWGDLLRVRALAIAKAAAMMVSVDFPPEDRPSPAETGIEVNAACDKVVINDRDATEAYFDAWLAANGVTEGMSWTPDPLTLGAVFLEHLAPHCGVHLAEHTPEILGVDTPQKAVMVGVFAINVAVSLFELGIIDQDGLAQLGVEIADWAAQFGVDDLMAMADEVFVVPGIPGLDTRPSIQPGPEQPLDDWEEPLQNEKVANGSVGGEGGGIWRVYKDNVGDYQNAYYFKVWRKGRYTEDGPFQSADEAQEAALAWILSPPDQGGIGGNPSTRFLLRNQPTRGGRALAAVASVLTGRPSAQGLGNVVRRTRTRNAVRTARVKCPKCSGGGPCCWPRSCQPVTQGSSITTCTDRPRRHPGFHDCPKGTQWCPDVFPSGACCVNCDDPVCGVGAGKRGGRGRTPGRPGRLARRMRARTARR